MSENQNVMHEESVGVDVHEVAKKIKNVVLGKVNSLTIIRELKDELAAEKKKNDELERQIRYMELCLNNSTSFDSELIKNNSSLEKLLRKCIPPMKVDDFNKKYRLDIRKLYWDESNITPSTRMTSKNAEGLASSMVYFINDKLELELKGKFYKAGGNGGEAKYVGDNIFEIAVYRLNDAGYPFGLYNYFHGEDAFEKIKKVFNLVP